MELFFILVLLVCGIINGIIFYLFVAKGDD